MLANAALADGHRAVLDLDEVESAGGCIRAQVRAAFDAGDAFKDKVVVGVAMTTQDNLRIVFLEQLQHHKPVRNAVINRVMGDEDDRLVFRQVLQSLLEPAHILRRPVAIAHLHQRPLMHANETIPAVLEDEPVLLPDSRKVRRAGLGPLRVMVAGQDVAGNLEAVEDFPGQAELLPRAVFGDVTGKHHEAQAGKGIDVAHRGAQVLFAAG